MRRLLIIGICSLFLLNGCATIKGLFGKKEIGNPDDPDYINNIQTLKKAYKDGNLQALDELVNIYENPNQLTEARVAAGRSLAETQHPTALNSIANMVSTTTAVDYSLFKESVNMLGMFDENPKAANALVDAMHKLEENTNQVHILLVKNLNRVRTKDQIIALLDLYEYAKANMARTERLLAETLGAIGNNQTIPVLTSIAKDPKVQIGIRNKAVEILGKKNPNDVAIAFAELLGDPNTNLEVREFALNTMKGVQEENLVLALLNTYNSGKKEYYSLLNTMLLSLKEFNDPEVKKAVIEIALNNDYPTDIRKKAIDNLPAFKDASVIDGLMPLLESPENYIYYDNVINAIYSLGSEKTQAETVRRLAHKAHFSRREFD